MSEGPPPAPPAHKKIGLRPFLFAIACTAGGLCLLGGLAIVAGVAALIFVFNYPTNDRDNANPETRKEMTATTLEWGRLAPFPSTAKDFTIRTEGNSFTRTFRGAFSDDPATIRAWLKSSPGVMEGEKNGNTYELKTGEGASYGTIEVSPDGSRVTFRVSWS
jgi:hypothetical protein